MLGEVRTIHGQQALHEELRRRPEGHRVIVALNVTITGTPAGDDWVVLRPTCAEDVPAMLLTAVRPKTSDLLIPDNETLQQTIGAYACAGVTVTRYAL